VRTLKAKEDKNSDSQAKTNSLFVVELSRPEICHLVGVREDGKQSDESIFHKIGVFNRLKIS
jgi:hypothetical protein